MPKSCRAIHAMLTPVLAPGIACINSLKEMTFLEPRSSISCGLHTGNYASAASYRPIATKIATNAKTKIEKSRSRRNDNEFTPGFR